MLIATIIFMVLVALMCIFSVTVIIVDMKKSSTKDDTTTTEERQEEAAPVAEDTPIATIAEGSVVFSAQKLTHAEKYAELEGESKARYDEVVTYAMGIEGVKRVMNDKCEEFKLSSKRVVRMTIKKGIPCCEYNLVNDEFGKYVEDNKISVKHTATVLRLNTAKDTEAAKSAIDICVEAIRREKEERHQRDLARRREARKRAAMASDKN